MKKEWGVVMLLAAMVAFMGYRAMTCSTSSCGLLVPFTNSEGQSVSFQCSDWAVKDCEGNVFDSTRLKGKIALINFWKTDCGICLAEFPIFNKVQAQLKEQGVLIIAASLDGERPEVSRLVAKYKPNFPVVLASDEMVSQFPVGNGVPITFLVNREGQVVRAVRGAISENALKKLVTPFL